MRSLGGTEFPRAGTKWGGAAGGEDGGERRRGWFWIGGLEAADPVGEESGVAAEQDNCGRDEHEDSGYDGMNMDWG